MIALTVLLFTIFAIASVASVSFAFVSGKTAGIFAVVGVLSGALVACLLANRLPGTPRPVASETEKVAEADVLWISVKEDGILVLLTWPGLDHPRYYSAPRSPATEKSLSRARQRATATHRQLAIRNPFQSLASGTIGEGEEGDDSLGNGRGTKNQKTGDNDGAEGSFFARPPAELPAKEAF